jgi:hypothetical protein
MIYRKAPPTPTRLLLRVVAAAGAGALAATLGCGGSTSVAAVGAPDDASDRDVGPILTGSIANADASLPCGTGFCGSVGHLPDAGDAEAPTDASSDAHDGAGGFCCGSVVIRPDE